MALVKKGAIVPLNSPSSSVRQIPAGKFTISKLKAHKVGANVVILIEAKISDSEILKNDEDRPDQVFKTQANLPFKPGSTVSSGNLYLDNEKISLYQRGDKVDV